jgi:hypothetical protein
MSTAGLNFFWNDYVKNNNASQQGFVDHDNQQALQRYQLAVQNYNLSVDSGRPYPGPTPTVPNAMGLSAPDADGLQWEVDTGTPLTAALPLHTLTFATGPNAPVPTGDVINVGRALPGNTVWFSIGPLDTHASGFTTPPGTVSADGVSGVFHLVGAIGARGWYEKIG